MEVKLITIIYCIFFMNTFVFSQLDIPPACKAYYFESDQNKLEQLKILYGANKKLPSGFELAALRALSHYPDLQNVKVQFRFRKAKTAHVSRPRILSMLRQKHKRTYLIYISTEVPAGFEAGLLKHLPYNAQIGVLGHELGHTQYYMHRNFWQLIGDAVRYSLSKKFRMRYENATDLRTIEHRLGYQLLNWSRIVHPLLKKANRGQNYLEPEKIEEELR